jgi:hypothetical protein
VLAGVALLAGGTSLFDDESTSPAVACNFPPFDESTLLSAPPAIASQLARPPSAQARTIIGESAVEIHTKVCFESGATLESGGSGILISEGPPWRLVTAAHVVDNRQWEPERQVEITVRRTGSSTSGWQRAKVTRLSDTADIAELEVDMEDGVVWQAATVPALASAPLRQGQTLAFICFFEREIRRGVVLDIVNRAGDTRSYELDVGSGFGCSGAGAIDESGRLAGIVIQSNDDVTRVSDIQALR